MAVGRMYTEYPSCDGIQSASNRSNCFKQATNASPSNPGMASRCIEKLSRCMLQSGRNMRTRLLASLYAFIPSKHCNP